MTEQDNIVVLADRTNYLIEWEKVCKHIQELADSSIEVHKYEKGNKQGGLSFLHGFTITYFYSCKCNIPVQMLSILHKTRSQGIGGPYMSAQKQD